MPLNLSTVASVNPPQSRGIQTYLSWTPTAPGLYWQIYVGNKLAWHGTATGAWVIVPPGSTERITIGSVDAADATTNFSTELPAAPDRRVQLTWQGGSVEGADLAGFQIYASTAPGGPISYATPIATVGAFPGGIDVGAAWDALGWDSSPWDASQGTYSWTSDDLASGVWSFAVVPYDLAGNEGTAQTTTATIAAPPSPPPLFSDGTRLHYQLVGWDEAPWDSGGWDLPCIQLSWNPSTT